MCDLIWVVLTQRQLCDVELLLNGGFAPLQGFLVEADYRSVVEHMQLTNGDVWPIPIVLDQSDDAWIAMGARVGDTILMCDSVQHPVARLKVKSVYHPNKRAEAEQVYGTTSTEHPGVHYLMHDTGDIYIGGRVQPIVMNNGFTDAGGDGCAKGGVVHCDFPELRQTPADVKKWRQKAGNPPLIGFQTRNPMHRAHFDRTLEAMEAVPGAHLLIHPTVGPTKPGDYDYHTRIQCYQQVLNEYPDPSRVHLSVLPLAMRMAGSREAVWHALVRRNYGCTHFIVGRDHAGCTNARGESFYAPRASHQLCRDHDLGIEILPKVLDTSITNANNAVSGTQLKELLATGQPVPSSVAFPGVVRILQQHHAILNYQQHVQRVILSPLVVLFCGLSGAGKTTLAHHFRQAVCASFPLLTTSDIGWLDGDRVRRTLNGDLGFSRDDRNESMRRLGHVAALMPAPLVLVSAMAPYLAGREAFCDAVTGGGKHVVVIYLATPLSECRSRDAKNLYHRADTGQLSNVVGVHDAYEVPAADENVVVVESASVETTVQAVFQELQREKYF